MSKLNDPIEPLADHASKLAKEVDAKVDERLVKAIAGTDEQAESPHQDNVDAAVFQHNTAVAKELIKKAKAGDASDETRAAFNIDPKVAKELAEHAPPGVTIVTPR